MVAAAAPLGAHDLQPGFDQLCPARGAAIFRFLPTPPARAGAPSLGIRHVPMFSLTGSALDLRLSRRPPQAN